MGTEFLENLKRRTEAKSEKKKRIFFFWRASHCFGLKIENGSVWSWRQLPDGPRPIATRFGVRFAICLRVNRSSAGHDAFKIENRSEPPSNPLNLDHKLNSYQIRSNCRLVDGPSCGLYSELVFVAQQKKHFCTSRALLLDVCVCVEQFYIVWRLDMCVVHCTVLRDVKSHTHTVLEVGADRERSE